MMNNDLVAYLQPAPNRYDPMEWRDVTGYLSDIKVEPHRLVLRAALPPGLYHFRLETKDGAFDMNTAAVPMVQVPDGRLESVGPWDLDHLSNVMAMPMARTYVNGRLVGGLWFDMPGPEEVANSRLRAEFGIEATEGETEIKLEFVERDRDRIDWQRIRFLEIRKDDRSWRELLPAEQSRPRLYLNAEDADRLREQLIGRPEFDRICDRIRKDGSAGEVDFDLICLAHLLTEDQEIGQMIKRRVLEVCSLPTWSGKADPLVMGGDNDRGISLKLYMTALAWDWCRELFDSNEQAVIKDKVGTYLQKIFDFTVLQRAYMGCPSPEPHSLGTWNGTAIACMAFYDDLPLARKILPFFHGLFCDSLRLYPLDGKNVWVTYFPYHLVRYLAAAHTFGGHRPELSDSPFLDRLGHAMLACFNAPNSQELQRGLRTKEHRHLAAYLNRFHPTPDISSIYETFVEQERRTAGDVALTLFDLLYAPRTSASPAPFPHAPFFAKDIGMITFASEGQSAITGSLSAGLKAGRSVSFRIMPHNREFVPSLGSLQLNVDGSPVLVDISSYGQDSSLSNTMCFEDGGIYTQGQYLSGNVGPEKSSYIRRLLITDRFLYAHAVLTDELHPKHQVNHAERILVVDLQSGTMVISDSFEGEQLLRFATHLHCSGSVTEWGAGQYRLTGGQANLIAGIKDGDKGLTDEEKGEIYVTILNDRQDCAVQIEEPSWHPSYIYGLNGNAGEQDIRFGRFPRYRRWRLEYPSRVKSGAFLFALTGKPGEVSAEGNTVRFAGGARLLFADNDPFRIAGLEMKAEAVLADNGERMLAIIGARTLRMGECTLVFDSPVDLEVEVSDGELAGVVYAPTRHFLSTGEGIRVSDWQYAPHHNRSHNPWMAQIQSF
ncbi:hypothetical protein MJA45_24120 [Paenibacillus aurantius]|uniref:Heparinase n=1 Tax=Paenibacillus aurantius TaxID=2918900 RepID=A0AA96LBM1_9BACL|nr:hypothetical protein [Paenibacillus aurantius]WNQ10672.1 hypothetical protein MJA45_24120 [Paenibacillus aurantius]